MARVQGKWIAMLMATACAVLGACSHPRGVSAAPLIKRHAVAPAGSAAGKSVDTGPTDLVSAVSGNGGAEGPVGLKFQVAQRPVSGRPLLITLRLVANQPLDHLEARFHADEGLQLTQGGDFESPGHMEAGDSVDHALTLVPDHDGVHTLMATVTTGSDAEGISRSFVIPIVVAPPQAATAGSEPAARATAAVAAKPR